MNDNIYTTVINCHNLIERKQNVLTQFEKHNFKNYDFFMEYDANIVTDTDIQKYYSQNFYKWVEKIKIYNLNELDYSAILNRKKLNLNQISLTIKFGKIFEKLIDKTENYFIIFEDDIILDYNFNTKFANFLEQTPTDWDVIYFGQCAGLDSHTIEKKQHPASRGGAATLFKKKTIIDLSKTWFPFNLISDWELAYQHYLHSHNVYWWPSLIKQGSETKLFNSTLR